MWKRMPRGGSFRMRGEIRAAVDAASKQGSRPHKRCIVTADGQLLEPELARMLGLSGINFGSHHEGKRYCQLLLLRRAGEIVGEIELQPRFELLTVTPDGMKARVGLYIADFRYTNKKGQVVIEDAKQWAGRTELYAWKKRHVQLQFGITIEEV